MNVNQQSEIEDLFQKISKTQARNALAPINDQDLNKVRAFVVQSQRPLQAVRLLAKEREERLTDTKFTNQKDQIIAQAKELDRNARDFKDKQRIMVQQVESDLVPALNGQLLRKKKDEELEREQVRLKAYEQKIVEMQESIENRKADLESQQEMLASHKQFTTFLESVVKNNSLGNGSKGGGGDTTSNIEQLRADFINLKKENSKLKQRKRELNDECEAIRQNETDQITRMTNIMYTQSREMQEYQRQLEELQHFNSTLDAEYEQQIVRKNVKSKAIGQIIRSINNIYETAGKYSAEMPPRRFKNITRLKEDFTKTKTPKEFANDFCEILAESSNAIEDLIRVEQKIKLSEKERQALEHEKINAEFKARDAQQNNSQKVLPGVDAAKKAAAAPGGTILNNSVIGGQTTNGAN